jgi:hypothetical protein
MSANSLRAVRWTSRALSIVFAAFLSLFAADAFGPHTSFWAAVLAVLIHLIPVFILVAVIAVAWWRPWFGALAFPLFAAIHLVTMWGRLAWQGYVFIEGPMVLIGVLYLLSWRGASPANTP